jgi:hypothetical protein
MRSVVFLTGCKTTITVVLPKLESLIKYRQISPYNLLLAVDKNMKAEILRWLDEYVDNHQALLGLQFRF